MGAMTVRFDDGLEIRLRLVAAVEERPMSDIISVAVANYCADQLKDATFQSRARNHISKLESVLPPRAGGRP